MLRTRAFFGAAAVALVAAITGFATDTRAQGVVGEWDSVEPPPPPKLKAVTLDPKTTALLIIDFSEGNCTAERVPRCVTAIQHVKTVLDKARANHALVVYTGFPNMKPFRPEVTPMQGDPMVTAGGNKFHGTDLEKILKDHGIQTVVLTGTEPGAVLFTGAEAARLGYKLVVPVDTMPGSTLYSEQAVVWGFQHDPGLTDTVLTSADQINF